MSRCLLFLAALAATNAGAQEVFRCTAPDGKVTYQQAPCGKTDAAKKVDVTPANTIETDPAERERLLKAGDEAGKRLEARAKADEAERERRAEQKRRDEEREREGTIDISSTTIVVENERR